MDSCLAALPATRFCLPGSDNRTPDNGIGIAGQLSSEAVNRAAVSGRFAIPYVASLPRLSKSRTSSFGHPLPVQSNYLHTLKQQKLHKTVRFNYHGSKNTLNVSYES